MRGLLLIACLLTTAPVAMAHGDTIDLSLAGREAGCPGTQTFCFEVTEGDVDAIASGSTVHLTFVNEGASVHNAYVVDRADADPDRRDTAADAAIAHTGDVEAGGSEAIEFVVPEDASGLYVWCDVAGHEQLGMYVLLPLRQTNALGPGAGDGATNGEPAEGNEAPIPWALMVAALAAAAVSRRRSTR